MRKKTKKPQKNGDAQHVSERKEPQITSISDAVRAFKLQMVVIPDTAIPENAAEKLSPDRPYWLFDKNLTTMFFMKPGSNRTFKAIVPRGSLSQLIISINPFVKLPSRAENYAPNESLRPEQVEHKQKRNRERREKKSKSK